MHSVRDSIDTYTEILRTTSLTEETQPIGLRFKLSLDRVQSYHYFSRATAWHKTLYEDTQTDRGRHTEIGNRNNRHTTVLLNSDRQRH